MAKTSYMINKENVWKFTDEHLHAFCSWILEV